MTEFSGDDEGFEYEALDPSFEERLDSQSSTYVALILDGFGTVRALDADTVANINDADRPGLKEVIVLASPKIETMYGPITLSQAIDLEDGRYAIGSAEHGSVFATLWRNDENDHSTYIIMGGHVADLLGSEPVVSEKQEVRDRLASAFENLLANEEEVDDIDLDNYPAFIYEHGPDGRWLARIDTATQEESDVSFAANKELLN